MLLKENWIPSSKTFDCDPLQVSSKTIWQLLWKHLHVIPQITLGQTFVGH